MESEVPFQKEEDCETDDAKIYIIARARPQNVDIDDVSSPVVSFDTVQLDISDGGREFI